MSHHIKPMLVGIVAACATFLLLLTATVSTAVVSSSPAEAQSCKAGYTYGFPPSCSNTARCRPRCVKN